MGAIGGGAPIRPRGCLSSVWHSVLSVRTRVVVVFILCVLCLSYALSVCEEELHQRCYGV